MGKFQELIKKCKDHQFSQKSIIKLSWLWAIISISLLIMLPHEEFTKRITGDENALLINSAYVYYSTPQVELAMKHKMSLPSIIENPEKRAEYLISEFKELGISAYNQKFEIQVGFENVTGINTYGILKAPRGDGTEALVLSADWKSSNNEDNIFGVSLLLSLAHKFSDSNFWAKDIIFLITDGGLHATNSFLSAYYQSDLPPGIEKLEMIGNEIQLAVSLDFPNAPDSYEYIALYHDGLNGQLPNQDLLVTVAEYNEEHRVPYYVYNKPPSEYGYHFQKLYTMIKQLYYQALCIPSSPHGLFLKFGVSTISLQGKGDRGNVSMRELGWVIEDTFRSLNNLLERLHHSTHFYIMVESNRFIPLSHYIIPIILLGLLPIVVASLNLRALSKLNSIKDKIKVDNSKDKRMEDIEKYEIITPSPAIKFEGSIGGLGLYSFVLFMGLSFYIFIIKGLQLLIQSELLKNFGQTPYIFKIFSILIFLFANGPFKPNKFVSSDAKQITLAFASIFTLFLAPLNPGLSLLLSLLNLPFILIISPLDKLGYSFLSSILAFILDPITLTLVLSSYGLEWNSIINYHNSFKTWLPIAVFFVCSPLNLVYLIF